MPPQSADSWCPSEVVLHIEYNLEAINEGDNLCCRQYGTDISLDLI